jgi:hypothetical protein
VRDCGLKVFDGAGQLARDLRVQLGATIDAETLALVHKQCISGLTCSYALLEDGPRLSALFLHPQLLPPAAVVYSPRRKAPGRWITHAIPLGDEAGGRAAWGPELFFRQTDLDAERAWLAPLLMRLSGRLASRRLDVGDDVLWAWEHVEQRFYYRERGRRARLYGAGNTPLLRLEQAVHLAQPESVDDYLWAVGAVPLG